MAVLNQFGLVGRTVPRLQSLTLKRGGERILETVSSSESLLYVCGEFTANVETCSHPASKRRVCAARLPFMRSLA